MSSGTAFHINWNRSPCYMEQDSNLVKPMSPNVKMATKAHFAGFDSLMYGTCFLLHVMHTMAKGHSFHHAIAPRWPFPCLSRYA